MTRLRRVQIRLTLHSCLVRLTILLVAPVFVTFGQRSTLHEDFMPHALYMLGNFVSDARFQRALFSSHVRDE